MPMTKRDTAAKSGARMRESSHTLNKEMSGWPLTVNYGDKTHTNAP